MTKYVVCLLGLLIFGSEAVAQSPIGMAINLSGVTREQIVDGNVYALDITCRVSPDFVKGADRNVFFTNTRSHAVLVTTSPIARAVAGAEKLPENVRAIIKVFAVDKNTTLEERRECNHTLLVPGGRSLYIVPIINELRDYSASTVGTLFDSVAALIGPMFSLFTGAAVPAALATTVTNVKQTVSPLQKLLGTLNQGFNYTRVIDSIRVGTYRITTSYSVVTIRVRRVPSIVLDSNQNLRVNLREGIDNAPGTVDGERIDKSCQAVRGGLTQVGVTSQIDIAYVLLSLASKAGLTKDQAMDCLTGRYADDAIKFPPNVWKTLPEEYVIKQDDIERLFPREILESMSWDVLGPKLRDLVKALNQYSRLQSIPESALASLARLMAPQISIDDDGLIVSDKDEPMAYRDAIDAIKNKGFIKYGCYAGITERADQAVDGAAAKLMVFRVAPDVTKTTIDNVMLLRPVFKKGVISKLVVSMNRKHITTMLAAEDYNCNGFTVVKPSQP